MFGPKKEGQTKQAPAAIPKTGKPPAKQAGKTKPAKQDKSRKKRIDAIKVSSKVKAAVPYQTVCKNGMFASKDGIYTKIYQLTDHGLLSENENETKEAVKNVYGDLLNYFQPDIRPQLTYYNIPLEEENGRKNLIPEDSEEEETEKPVRMKHQKYLTLGASAENVRVAANIFDSIEPGVIDILRHINGADRMQAIGMDRRLSILHEMYHPFTEETFYQKMDTIERKKTPSTAFDPQRMTSYGLTTKDLVAPGDIQFFDDYFTMGGKIGRAFCLCRYASKLTEEIMEEITSIPCFSIVSVHFSPVRQDEALNLVKSQINELTKISVLLDEEEKQDLTTFEDEKSILMTVVFVIVEENYKQLERQTKRIYQKAEAHLCAIDKLCGQQESGFASAVPLGINRILVNRMLPLEEAVLFLPAIQKNDDPEPGNQE